MANPYFYYAQYEHLSKRIDLAWQVYCNRKCAEYERMEALEFLIYAFDLYDISHESNALNKELYALMIEKGLNQQHNPYYIPTAKKTNYHFNAFRYELTKTDKSGVSNNPKVQTLLDNKDLLDVNKIDKEEDVLDSTTYLKPNQRAEFHLQIAGGRFCKNGENFDSSAMRAHGKKGFVAFTLNTNGELSVFQHNFVKPDSKGRKLAHSSMNAGAPVLAAGEIEIKDGKLISINTFSGHYKPSLYSVYRFLNYLSERGIDISNTAVYLKEMPHINSKLQAGNRTFDNSQVYYLDKWYRVNALDIVTPIKTMLKQNLHDIISYNQDMTNRYLSNGKTWFFCDILKLDKSKKKSSVCQFFKRKLDTLSKEANNANSIHELQDLLTSFIHYLDKFAQENNKIRKDGDRLSKIISTLTANLEAQKNQFEHQKQTLLSSYRSTY